MCNVQLPAWKNGEEVQTVQHASFWTFELRLIANYSMIYSVEYHVSGDFHNSIDYDRGTTTSNSFQTIVALEADIYTGIDQSTTKIRNKNFDTIRIKKLQKEIVVSL